MTPQIKKTLKVFLQLIFSVGVLVWLVYALGAKNLIDTFAHANVDAIAGCVMLYLVAQLLSVWRWRTLGQMFGFKGGFWRFNSIYFLGMFYNIFLPTGYGGDVVKAIYQAPLRVPPSKTLAGLTVFLDRVCGLAALLLIGGAASWGLGAQLGVYGAVMAWGSVALVVLAILLVAKFSSSRYLPRKLRFVILTLRAKGQAFVPVAVLSLMIQLLNVAIYFFIFQSLGASLTISQVAFAYAIVTLATLIPVSIGGLGVRESGWAALLIAFQGSASIGVSAGLLYFLVQTLSSLLGIVPFFKEKLPAKLLTQTPPQEAIHAR